MPEIFIDGRAVQAEKDQTVLQAALANGIFIPYFCWHPQLSVAGNCRICVVEVEAKGGSWLDISCNMPVSEGMRVRTDSEEVRAQRKAILQFITLNHPVDCGICDKAGECTLQDYHYAYNGAPSISHDPKVRATKFFDLSRRILLDNERCILCSRCVRFTREISKSHALGIEDRGDHSLVRPAEDGCFDDDPYSDNVIDLCPVGALLAKSFLYKARVWYLRPTPSVCPGCERGCAVNLWHRRPEWQLNALDPRQNTAIARVTPRENPAVNGPWICNKGRDLAAIFERARAEQAMLKGAPVGLAEAIAAARRLIEAARHPVALVSNWGSNEELAAFKRSLAGRFSAAFVKIDRQPDPGERLEDDFLIKRDKNPNTAGARALFDDAPAALPAATDLVLVWGEGGDFARLPAGAKTILLGSYLAPENGHADVFIPVSIQTERRGSYTNFAGVVSTFEPCFAKKPAVADAEALFAQLGAEERVPA
ncbi:MAG: 2Fe-2S iron-sulfur cluster-binding protein [Burkholderiales bacterium]|nr:2Fe-2S iron-sulfur cluster-binding protein [Burkholderiales bacterium]